MRNGEFEFPALAEVYDAEYGWGIADDYVLEFVNRQTTARVADVGCGTGRLTVALAAAGHTVAGVDPASASLARARNRPQGDSVRWILGTATALAPSVFDCVVMTAHVAQFLVTDEEWEESFAAVHAALVPGGRLFFDSRNPAAKAWQDWNPNDSRRHIEIAGRSCTSWTQIAGIRDPEITVEFTRHYEFSDGERLTSESSLRFRTESTMRKSLQRIGFEIDRTSGSWPGEPLGTHEFLVEAHRLL